MANRFKATDSLSYDAEGRAKEFRYDENAHKLTLEYESGKTIATDSKGNKTTYYYEEVSGHRLVTRIVNSQGHGKEFAWDSHLNKIRSVDENGHITTMSYDGRGNLLTMTDPAGRPHRNLLMSLFIIWRLP